MKKVIIFGVGQLGKIAYEYYCKRYDISYFVDNNQKNWNTYIYDLPVFNPEILKNEKDLMVIVPDGTYKGEMCRQLYLYGIKEILIMEFSEKIYTPYEEKHIHEPKEEFIISFKGGLGNQLFQYAFMRYLVLKEGKNCSADLSYYIYPNVMEYVLDKSFADISVARCNPYLRESYIVDKEYYYKEPDFVKSAYDSFLQSNITKKGCGYLEGCFQSSFYPENIKDILYKELIFEKITDKGVEKYLSLFEKKNTVSIHIRRGDYLTKENIMVFGNICTEKYYKKAMEYMKTQVDNPIYIFFSNDKEWVKNNYNMDNAIYINEDDFENYKDWYDMYLMSMCKHNIIANSTFSWWGAWLNRNSQKIVIAPQNWFHQEAVVDICPREWIRI